MAIDKKISELTTVSGSVADADLIQIMIAGAVPETKAVSASSLFLGRGLSAHASTHKNGGSDEVATGTPSAYAIPKAGSGSKLDNGWINTGSGNGLDADTVDTYHLSDIASGWFPAGETWTYASSSSFTVASDVTSKYQTGDKIKLTQTTVKYFYIIALSYSAPNTTITINAGSDYTLANAAITNNHYSKEENPYGFPSRFNYTPTWTNTGASQPAISNGTLLGTYKLLGKTCIFDLNFVTGSATTFGTSTGSWAFSAPLTSGSYKTWQSFAYMRRSGVANYIRLGQIVASASMVQYFISLAEGVNDNNIGPTVPFTWSTNADLMNITGFHYEIT